MIRAHVGEVALHLRFRCRAAGRDVVVAARIASRVAPRPRRLGPSPSQRRRGSSRWGVGPPLVPPDVTRRSPDHTRLTQRQGLEEQGSKRGQLPCAEPGDRPQFGGNPGEEPPNGHVGGVAFDDPGRADIGSVAESKMRAISCGS